MAVEYMDYEKFKKVEKFKKYSHDVVINLTGNGFTFIAGGQRNYDFVTGKYTESNLDYVKAWVDGPVVRGMGKYN